MIIYYIVILVFISIFLFITFSVSKQDNLFKTQSKEPLIEHIIASLIRKIFFRLENKLLLDGLCTNYFINTINENKYEINTPLHIDLVKITEKKLNLLYVTVCSIGKNMERHEDKCLFVFEKNQLLLDNIE